MKRALLVVIGFAAITILLTWFWGEWGRFGYGRFLKTVAPPIYDLIGFPDARVGAMRQRYINWVPFVGLVLVTPGLALRRRTIGLLAGLGLLFVSHLALNLTERWQPGRSLPVVASMISDALPFVIWIAIAYPVVSRWFVARLADGDATENGTESVPGDATENGTESVPGDATEDGTETVGGEAEATDRKDSADREGPATPA